MNHNRKNNLLSSLPIGGGLGRGFWGWLGLCLLALPLALTSCGSDKDDPEDPTVEVDHIACSHFDEQLTVGDEPLVVAYRVLPEDATDKTVTVKTSDEAVCTARLARHEERKDIDSDYSLNTGYLDITPVAAGTATITLTSKSNPSVTTTIDVTVKAKGEDKPGETTKAMEKIGFYLTLADGSHKTLAPTGTSVEAQAGTNVSVTLTDMTNAPFNIYQASITGARWESTNTSVATLAQSTSTRDNTITLRAAGSAIIKVTAPDGSFSFFKLNVIKPEKPYVITGTDGKKYLLTKVGNYAVEYDDEGELKTLAGLPRLADGRFRGGDYTVALTFKSGTHLLERMTVEKEGTQRNVTTLTFQYDAMNRLVRCTNDWEQNGVKEGNTIVITLTWNDEKLLSTYKTGRYNSATDMQYTLFYSGNRTNPLKRMGISPVVFSGLYTNTFSEQLCAALSALGCFGEGPAVLPSSRSLLYYGNTTSLNVTCTLNAAGLITKEDFSPSWESTSQMSYQYTTL